MFTVDVKQQHNNNNERISIPGNKRRRSSLFSSLSSLASVAFASAVGHQPEPDRVSSSSSSDDEEETISNKRATWLDSTTTDTSTPVTFTLSPEAEETPHTSGVDNEVFRYDDETVSKLQNSHNDEVRSHLIRNLTLETPHSKYGQQRRMQMWSPHLDRHCYPLSL